VTARPLLHPLLAERGIEHGFGVRGTPPPANARCARQVHGARIATERECESAIPPEADGVASASPGVPVAVFTADCVPILLSTSCGTAVAAVHAGWRGLAAGVVAAGVAAVRELASGSSPLVAAIGPHIGACCYEVDAPVIAALRGRFAHALPGAVRPTRPGHVAIDLAALVREALTAAGLDPASVGALPDACTHCDPERFHSYRRDGLAAGRLVHFIAARSRQA
jgi:YfiH family protein